MRTIGRLASTLVLACLLATLLGIGCEDDGVSPRNLEPAPTALPSYDQPEHIVQAMQIIYNDTLRTADERYVAFRDLFPPETSSLGFVFFFQERDVQAGLPPSWGLSQELETHRNLFQAQENGQVFSLRLQIVHEAPVDLEFPDPGQETWKLIRATNVNLRLMVNPNDGFEVNGGQADFTVAPADGRWYLVEWRDRPRP